MRIALAQLNPIVGDIAGNTAVVLDAIAQAKRERADILVTSELVLIGYPPRDLLLRDGVVEACEDAVRRIAEHSGDLWVLVGHPRRSAAGTRPLRNSASICHSGHVVAVCDKQLLPGYDVFDEDRYFEPGARSLVLPINDRRVGVVICEDLWRANDVLAERRYTVEPAAELAAQECDIILSLNASPFVLGKWQRHLEQMAEVATDFHVPVVAVNQVGGNDDLIFDGRSVAVNKDGSIRAVLPGFESCVQTIDVSVESVSEQPAEWREPSRETFHALVLGVRDYCRKTGHTDVLIGLSGGIDSALTAVIASAALGPRHVHGVMMPSKYSSPGSIDDSLDLSKRLGLARCEEITINAVHQAMQSTLTPALGKECVGGITDENVQARLRGVMLMAMSNAMPKSLVLATSNKSEIATGYSTLYGDMCGAVAVLGDLTKTRIYELARWINSNFNVCGFARPPIPENSLTKPPSAELRPNQTDQDTLPPYPVIDEIIRRRIELEQSADTIIGEAGFETALVNRWLTAIDRAQYKRDQAPVIPKVTGRAFGRGRPMPIVMKGEVISDQRPVATGDSKESKASPQAPVGTRAPKAKVSSGKR
jgi:NAD+ synthetase